MNLEFLFFVILGSLAGTFTIHYLRSRSAAAQFSSSGLANPSRPAHVPATADAAPSSLADRVAAWSREFFGPVEFSKHDQCSDCERPCRRVNPELATAPDCTGRIFLAQCSVCPEVVELTPDLTCPSNPNHRLVESSKHPKPRSPRLA